MTEARAGASSSGRIPPTSAVGEVPPALLEAFWDYEAALRADGRSPSSSSLEEMDRLWTQAKVAEKSETGA